MPCASGQKKGNMSVRTNNYIFYHIPCTGGSWVKRAIRHVMKGNRNFFWKRPDVEDGEVDEATYWERLASDMLSMKKGHLTPSQITKADKDGLFSFAFVREPISWYKSYWANRGRVRELNGKSWHTFIFDWAWDENFETFCGNMLRMFPEGALTTLYKCFLGEDGTSLDFVGKQESLKEDLIKVLDGLGEKYNLTKIEELEKENTTSEEIKKLCVLSTPTKKKLMSHEQWIYLNFYPEYLKHG